MATRKIKDAQDTTTNELIYFKGHAKATYMSDGRNVEDAIHQIGTGGGGGGGIIVETDPIFSASPAASITEDDKEAWNNKVPYSSKDFRMVNADGFMTAEGDGFVFPNTPAAQDGQGLVLVTLDDIPNILKTINGESIVGEGNVNVGKIAYFNEEDALELSPGVVWMRRGSVVTSVQITGFASNGNDYEEYAYHFYTGAIAEGTAVKLLLPDGVKYANKDMFDALESDTHYELSVVRSAGIVKAVLTAFK